MKTRTFITGLLCLLGMVNAYGQDAPHLADTVVLELRDQLRLSINVRDYDHLHTKLDVVQIIREFQQDLQQVAHKFPEDVAYKINYHPKSLLKIEEKQPVSKYRVTQNQIKLLPLQNSCHISGSKLSIDIDFNDHQELLDPQLGKAVQNMLGQLPARDRYSKTLQYEATDFSTLPRLKEERINSNYLDMLSLGLGVGANVIYNQYLTDLSTEIGIQLNHKGIIKNQFYLSNNLYFSYDPERQLLLNNFSNIGYRRNLSHIPEKSNWLGVELGMLTSRRGTFFPENTYRIGVNWEAAKHISVMPALYFNGTFKQVSPGIRIGFGL